MLCYVSYVSGNTSLFSTFQSFKQVWFFPRLFSTFQSHVWYGPTRLLVDFSFPSYDDADFVWVFGAQRTFTVAIL